MNLQKERSSICFVKLFEYNLIMYCNWKLLFLKMHHTLNFNILNF